jgi:hypothetical protein
MQIRYQFKLYGADADAAGSRREDLLLSQDDPLLAHYPRLSCDVMYALAWRGSRGHDGSTFLELTTQTGLAS